MPRHPFIGSLMSLVIIAALTAACSKSPSNEIVIVGDANYRERIAAPNDATFEAMIVDITDTDKPAKNVASYKKDDAGQPPYAYRLSYKKDDLKQDRQYVLRANLSQKGVVVYTTQDTYSVKHGQAPAATSLRLVKTGNAAPATSTTDALKQDAHRAGEAIKEGSRELGHDLAEAGNTLADKTKAAAADAAAATRNAAAGAATATKALADDVKNSEVVRDTKQAIKELGNRNLQDTYWRLTTVPNVAYNAAQLEADAHLVLHSSEQRLAGSDGCNALSGSYTHTKDHDLSFRNVTATERSCAEGKNVAGAISAALSATARYSISGSTLTLMNAAGSPVATFNAVDL